MTTLKDPHEMIMSNGDCVRDCRPVNGVLAHDLALHLGLRCHKCGHFITWFNDVPLRGFCWGPEAKEHPEWSALVPAEYNPYL